MNRPRKLNRHLPRNVYFKHGAYWYVKAGKWQKLGADLKSSLAAYASIVEAPKGGMAELIDKVLLHVSPKLSVSTRKQYAGAGRRLKKILIEFSPEQVRSSDVAGIKVALAHTPNYANRCLSLLRIVFAHAVEWQLVESNPCIGIRRHEEHKRDRYLTDAEFRAIHDKAGPRLQVIMDLCYLTAQRITDVLAIRRNDLTTDGISFVQKKTGVRLTVAWTTEMRVVTERAKGLGKNVAALTLLYNRRGKVPDYRTVKLQWDDACAAAGVKDAHLHDVRAKALTDAKRQGQNATALAGHTDPRMTERYIRLRESPIVNGPSFRQAVDK